MRADHLSHIKTESFEGPLDLLLSLIEKRKFFINDISLSRIADDFLARADELPELPLRETADFVFVASTLVLMKSRSLLPGLPTTSEEEKNIEDLKRRLIVYGKIQELAAHLRERFGIRRIFPRGEKWERVGEKEKKSEQKFAPGEDITMANITRALEGVILSLPKKETLPRGQVKKLISLEEVMSRLLDRIQTHMAISFRDFAGKANTGENTDTHTVKAGIIVSFLALLELVRRGAVLARQEKPGGDIRIENREISVPRY